MDLRGLGFTYGKQAIWDIRCVDFIKETIGELDAADGLVKVSSQKFERRGLLSLTRKPAFFRHNHFDGLMRNHIEKAQPACDAKLFVIVVFRLPQLFVKRVGFTRDLSEDGSLWRPTIGFVNHVRTLFPISDRALQSQEVRLAWFFQRLKGAVHGGFQESGNRDLL